MGCSSEFRELSEPDQRRGNKGVAPVFPSIKRGCSKLPSWDLGHLEDPEKRNKTDYISESNVSDSCQMKTTRKKK